MQWKANILAALWATLCISGGCQPTSGSGSVDRSPQAGIPTPEEDDLSNLDLGGDWDQYESQLSTRNTTRGTAGAGSRGPKMSGDGGEIGPGFVIVLGTFTGEGHLQQANQYYQQAVVLLPDMSSGLRVRPSGGGSLVVFGNYTGWKDPRARNDVKTLQELTINGRQVFPQAMIAELEAPRDPSSIEEAERAGGDEAIMAALLRRSATGKGIHLDVAATEGVLSLMALSIDQYLATGEVAGPREVLLTGRYAFYDVYPTKDGKWVSVGAIEPKFYKNLCNALGLERYATSQMEDAKQDEIRDAFKQAFLTGTRDEWTERLAAADTCVAPVLSIPELVDDPHFEARKIFSQAHHEEHGDFRQVSHILAGGMREQPVHEVRPFGSSDAHELLAAAGYDAAEIEKLSAEGAIA